MELEFVNHASFILRQEKVSLMTDPWLEGKVFNQGWDLISETSFGYERFKEITHLWFSHEHPDHFSPPVLKKIPSHYRENITVLFQHTIDQRVAEFCRQAGFKAVVELKRGNWMKLDSEFEILCEYFDEGDSWICFKCEGTTILNTNDCAIRNKSETDYIKQRIGHVDLLLTQFSYAYWAGNKNDLARRQNVASEKLQLLKFQCDEFKPGIVIPIASFVYFCHEENFYLNDSINDIRKTRDFIRQNTGAEPVIVYNGDVYQPGKKWDSEKAIGKHMNDLQKIRDGKVELVRNQTVEENQLLKESMAFSKLLRERSHPLLRLYLRPSKVYCYDLDTTYFLSPASGLNKAAIDKNDCDVSLSSESLLFCMKHPYGLDTTQINGRLQKPPGGNYKRFYNLFRIAQQESRGKKVNLAYLSGVVVRKFGQIVRLRG